jgi:hypothetical protein
MSTPVLIDPSSGNIILNVKTGPAPSTYVASSLDGPKGALSLFKLKLESITGQGAKTAAQTAHMTRATEYTTMRDQQHALAGELYTAKLQKNPGEIDRLTRELAKTRAAKQEAKGSKFNNTQTQRKIACGWTKGWMTGRLSPPSKPGPGCSAKELGEFTVFGGTRKLRKRARRSNTSKH